MNLNNIMLGSEDSKRLGDFCTRVPGAPSRTVRWAPRAGRGEGARTSSRRGKYPSRWKHFNESSSASRWASERASSLAQSTLNVGIVPSATPRLVSSVAGWPGRRWAPPSRDPGVL